MKRSVFYRIADGHPYTDGISKCPGSVLVCFCPRREATFCFCDECDACWTGPDDISSMNKAVLIDDLCGPCRRIQPAESDQVDETWRGRLLGTVEIDIAD